MRSTLLIVAAFTAQGLTLPGLAHHSHGNYEMTEYTYLTGKVTDLYWANPHTWVYLEVLDADGRPTAWALEAAGSSTLARRGVTEETVAIGDNVSVRCHQLRDGSTGCLLGFLTPEGGVEKEWD
jgi:hypothetical protein